MATTLNLVTVESNRVPEADYLVTGPHGVIHTDIVKVDAEGKFLRGTLLKRYEKDKYRPATAEDCESVGQFAILADDILNSPGHETECAVYLEGDFNLWKVIFIFEPEGEDHEGIARSIAWVLRYNKIFLRKVAKSEAGNATGYGYSGSEIIDGGSIAYDDEDPEMSGNEIDEADVNITNRTEKVEGGQIN